MSATIIPFLQGCSFDPDITRAMGVAYDKAREMLHDRCQPEVVQEVIAQRIINVAKSGERDPDRICQRAMTSLGLERGVQAASVGSFRRE